MNLSKNVKITQVLVATATGTTTINTSVVDMQGYDGVVFLVSTGSAAADIGVKLQQGQVSDGSDAADLAGSKQLSDATQKAFVLDLYQPQERYVRAAIQRTTTTTIEAAWAIQYCGAKMPINNVTAAQAAKLLASPDEGTA